MSPARAGRRDPMARAESVTKPQAKAVARYVRISPFKVRIVLDLIRGKSVSEAETILKFTNKRAARIVGKVVHSAAANATHNLEMDEEQLYIAEAFADGGPTLKRFHPRARGQAFPIMKRTSHITVVVREREEG